MSTGLGTPPSDVCHGVVGGAGSLKEEYSLLSDGALQVCGVCMSCMGLLATVNRHCRRCRSSRMLLRVQVRSVSTVGAESADVISVYTRSSLSRNAFLSDSRRRNGSFSNVMARQPK